MLNGKIQSKFCHSCWCMNTLKKPEITFIHYFTTYIQFTYTIRDVTDQKRWGFDIEPIRYRTQAETFGAVCVSDYRMNGSIYKLRLFVDKRMPSVSVSVLLSVARWQFWGFSFRFDIESVWYCKFAVAGGFYDCWRS